MTGKIVNRQIACHITRTTLASHRIIQAKQWSCVLWFLTRSLHLSHTEMGASASRGDARVAVALSNPSGWIAVVSAGDDGGGCGVGGAGDFCERQSALRHGTTNMNTLVSLGTGVAFAYSVYATIARTGRNVYFDAVLLIVGFLTNAWWFTFDFTSFSYIYAIYN